MFSVGGGSRELNVSVNLVNAIEQAHAAGASIFGVVGAPAGRWPVWRTSRSWSMRPPHLRTPLVESFQAVVWHALVSHPVLAVRQGHWESLTDEARP